MKLYYAPGACSQAAHIVAREGGLTLQLVKVALGKSVTEQGADYKEISPLGFVPLLQFDDGRTLGECSAVVQYLADQAPQAGLLAPAGSFERNKTQEWLSFIATEIHKSFSPLFNPRLDAAAREQVLKTLTSRLNHAASQLEKQDYLVGNRFSVADAYLFVTLGWTQYTKVDLAAWPALTAFVQRVAARPAVQATLKAEGLI
ncbi:glutathione transferase GstA [Denitratisoma sp. DHT3]|uniref:glutathione transferase GstA n=1 Tax=Denitratisoma sp. DHT3 TaxID=1981880 RepID=UPI00119857D4|nr:glutathione transferase GstA [Denitratisoma sp. DHT3]QDX79814.1 glutathione transferase GstA [Denitratisoma sp. DHT3]